MEFEKDDDSYIWMQCLTMTEYNDSLYLLDSLSINICKPYVSIVIYCMYFEFLNYTCTNNNFHDIVSVLPKEGDYGNKLFLRQVLITNTQTVLAETAT